MNVYEILGHKVVELQDAVEAHVSTLSLLALLKSGQVKIENILLDGQNWKVMEPKPVEEDEAEDE